MKIGIDQFSYHRFYGDVFPWESAAVERWTLADTLRCAQALGVSLVGLHLHYLLDDELKGLPDQLTQHGLDAVLEWGHPDGLQMGQSSTPQKDLANAIGTAQSSGVTLLRIVCGYPTWRGREPVADQTQRLVPILRELGREAQMQSVTLAVENHADFTPLELANLIERVDLPCVRACFDTGNSARLGVDPVEAAAQIAPLTAMVHLKDLVVLDTSRGDPTANWPSAPLGQGSFDVPGILEALFDGGFDGPVMIEMAQMHPDWPDEQAAVEKSVRWLARWPPGPSTASDG